MQVESHTVEEILGAVRDTLQRVPYCWAVTADARGGASARLVQPFFSKLDDDGWVVRFLTGRSSRKAVEIARSGRVSLAYQYDREQAGVTLVGAARIIDDRGYIHDNWRADWNLFFPTGPSDVNAVFVEVTAEGIEVFNLARRIAAPPNGQ